MDASKPGVLNRVDNISCSGVLCRTDEPVAVMTKMSIILELPKPMDRRVQADGVVVRCDPERVSGEHFNVAILFQHLSDDDYEAIREYVDQDLTEKAER